MPIIFNFRRRQSEVKKVGILDQISIRRNPATADLKHFQYSTMGGAPLLLQCSIHCKFGNSMVPWCFRSCIWSQTS